MPLLLLFWVSVLQAEKEPELPPLHHLVDRLPPKSMTIDEDFPLDDDGRIVCKTCHAIDGIEEMTADEIDREDESFFRGGPYERISDFCYRCHEREEYRPTNIHRQLDDQGEVIEERCTFCHEEVLEGDQEYSAGELALRLDPQALCIGCHLRTPHLNALEHEQALQDEMLDRRHKRQVEEGVTMPLGKDHRILCITCHNPHEYGVIDPELPAGRQVADRAVEEGIGYRDHPWDRVYREDKKKRLQDYAERHGRMPELGYRRLTHELLLRLPAKNGRLCGVCHEFEEQ